jgi:hypothetical protein
MRTPVLVSGGERLQALAQRRRGQKCRRIVKSAARRTMGQGTAEKRLCAKLDRHALAMNQTAEGLLQMNRHGQLEPPVLAAS